MTTSFGDSTVLIASGLDSGFNAAVSSAVPKARLMCCPQGRVWDIPDGTRVVLTDPSIGWAGAPAKRPGPWSGVEFVQSVSTGMDGFPTWVTSMPMVACSRGSTSDSIAEYAIGAMLNHEKSYGLHRVRARSEWASGDVGGLAGRTLGLAGFGSIGQAIAKRALAFEMEISVLRRSDAPLPHGLKAAANFAELAAQSHHLVIAVPLTDKTRSALGPKVLASARPGMHLVNISRGAILDIEALRRAMDMGRVAAATLDVTDPEPLPSGHWAYDDPRIHLTPHMSWKGGVRTRELQERVVVENLQRFVAGKPLVNLYDRSRGY